MIVEGQDEGGVLLRGPPTMRRRIVLPKFTDGRALPASPGFWTWPQRSNPLSKMVPDVGGHSRPGSMKRKAAG